MFSKYFLGHLGDEGKIGEGVEVITIIRIKVRFLEIGRYSSSFEGRLDCQLVNLNNFLVEKCSKGFTGGSGQKIGSKEGFYLNQLDGSNRHILIE